MLAVEERIDIKVEQPSVLRYLGYQAGRKVPKRIVSLVDRHIEDTSMMIEPKHSFVIKDAERVEGDTLPHPADVEVSVQGHAQRVGPQRRHHREGLLREVSIGAHDRMNRRVDGLKGCADHGVGGLSGLATQRRSDALRE